MMNSTISKIVMISWITLSLSAGVFARGPGGGGGHMGGGGGHFGGGGHVGGGVPGGGFSGPGRVGGGAAVHAPPAGGVHVPQGGIPQGGAIRNPAAGAVHAPPATGANNFRSPAFSQPNAINQHPQFHSTNPQLGNRSNLNSPLQQNRGPGNVPGGANPALRNNLTNPQHQVGAQNNNRFLNQNNNQTLNHNTNIVNQNNSRMTVQNNSGLYGHRAYRGSWNYGMGGYGYGPGYGRYGYGPGYGGLGYGGLGYGGLGYGGLGYGGLGYGGLGYGLGYGGLGYGLGYGGLGYGYGFRPLGWGLGGFGLGALAYNSGYLGYSNPYYMNSYGSYGNYSYAQPIPVTYSGASSSASSCDDALDSALAAFKQNDYDAALDIVNKAVQQCPNDSVLHEFRALIFFAKGDFQQGAAVIHSVLAVGPGWNWTTMANLYPSVSIYTTQLRALEAFTKANPKDGASRFLLGYHYMVDGYPDVAAREFKEVVALVPNDRVASDMSKLVSQPTTPSDSGEQPTPRPPVESNLATPAESPAQTSTPVKQIDPATLVGTWQASRDDGSKFGLTLNQDSTFEWKFNLKDKHQDLTGKYKVDGDVLVMEGKDGGALIGKVTPDSDRKFNFKLVGAPQEDPGLNFSK